MKAIVQTALGEPKDVLELIDIENQRQLAPGEVLIDVKLAPVHHGDLLQTRFQPSIPEDLGYVRRGSEAVGIISELGPGIENQGDLKLGDRVIGFPAIGSWGETVIVPSSSAIPIPPELDDEVAAQLLVNYITARTILRTLRKSIPDDLLSDGAVLVTGASTVVARLLLILLKQDGVYPIGLARSNAGAARVTAQLKDVRVAATEDADWQAQITSFASGKKIVGLLDCVSGALVGDLLPLLADGAAIVNYGSLSGDLSLPITTLDLIGRQFIVRGAVFARWFFEVAPGDQADDVRSAIKLASDMPFLFKAASVHELSDIQGAISAVEAPNRDGFVFIKP